MYIAELLLKSGAGTVLVGEWLIELVGIPK